MIFVLLSVQVRTSIKSKKPAPVRAASEDNDEDMMDAPVTDKIKKLNAQLSALKKLEKEDRQRKMQQETTKLFAKFSAESGLTAMQEMYQNRYVAWRGMVQLCLAVSAGCRGVELRI